LPLRLRSARKRSAAGKNSAQIFDQRKIATARDSIIEKLNERMFDAPPQPSLVLL